MTEALDFDTYDAAKKKCDAEFQRVEKEIREKIALDAKHRGTDPKSPGAGKFKDYDPIGKMPGEPTKEPEDPPKANNE